MHSGKLILDIRCAEKKRIPKDVNNDIEDENEEKRNRSASRKVIALLLNALPPRKEDVSLK